MRHRPPHSNPHLRAGHPEPQLGLLNANSRSNPSSLLRLARAIPTNSNSLQGPTAPAEGEAMPSVPRKSSSSPKIKREKSTAVGLTEGPLHSRESCTVAIIGREDRPIIRGSESRRVCEVVARVFDGAPVRSQEHEFLARSSATEIALLAPRPTPDLPISL